MKNILSLILIILCFSAIVVSGQPNGNPTISVGLLAKDSDTGTQEFKSLEEILVKTNNAFIRTITPGMITRKASILKDIDILWFFKNDSLVNDKDYTDKLFTRISNYVFNGGKVILANQAAWFTVNLHLETTYPRTRLKTCNDEGYGRQLGYHAFLGHALFDGMHGGSYVLKPTTDTIVMQTGFFGKDMPGNGKVVAVDWDYIFLREDSKMILEYEFGRGKVMAVGGYLLYSLPNRNRDHLERFTANLIDYMAGRMNESNNHYWNYQSGNAIDTSFNLAPFSSPISGIEIPDNHVPGLMDILPGRSSGNYWDLAGERMLLMGQDNGGITEIWAHPVMSLRDYKVNVDLKNNDKGMQDLADFRPEIEVREATYVRKYNLGDDLRGPILDERIAVSPDRPQAVVHYHYNGKNPIDLRIDFTLLFRLMWPYSEKVLGNLYYAWNDKLKAFIATDQSGEFVTMIGVIPERDEVPGSAPRISITGSTGTAPREKPLGMTSRDCSIMLALEGPVSFHVIIASSCVGLQETLSHYLETVSDPASVFEMATSHADSLPEQFLVIEGPDKDFNKGYAWAILATDRFQVNTPGIGSSLVAGYATSDKGWDGGQVVSGRPGYGWYFGRDGEWSGFALLQYGDFDKVKEMLTVFQKFQDLNGKIFHELSTSGIVHYDAADATPLFIVLAGRYLKHSGDREFIMDSWPSIQKAIDFCYSTDTDGDMLIENTNVGHGWVEGGHLFGSHTSLHLASCWAAALDEAAYLAGEIELNELAGKYKEDASIVKEIINTKFWNPQMDYYYQGLLPDGTYMDNITIMPAIPMLFGQADPDKAEKVLPVIASDAFTADWGCRIVPTNDPHFNPGGYHTGSIWPLFTGWAALAEFRNGNYLEGFAHLNSNMLIWKYWGLGFNEEVLNGETYQPSGVCHHQCWSETMAIQPLIEGMLGYSPDALNHNISLKPWFPADWDSVTVRNLRIGDESIDMRVQRSMFKVQGLSIREQNFVNELKASGVQPDDLHVTAYTLQKEEPGRLNIHFQPVLPSGAKVDRITVNDQPAREWEARQSMQGWTIADFGFWLDSTAVVKIYWHNGITALPLLSNPHPGDASAGFRILSTDYSESTYTLTLQAPRASRQEFRVWAAQPNRVSANGAEIKGISGNIVILIVDFPDLETDFAVKKVEMKVK